MEAPHCLPNLSPLGQLLQLLLNDQMHPNLRTHFSSNWFMALHKDPHDPSKLRPIGIGTALH